MPDSLLMLAGSMAEKGMRRTGVLGDGVALGLSVGSAISLNPKDWPNEDSLAAHDLADDGVLAVVADAHFGGAASESLARHAREAFTAEGSGLPQERLLGALWTLDERLHAESAPGDDSVSTCLMVHARGRSAAFVSVGDSLLYRIRGDRCVWLNPPTGRFSVMYVGSRPLVRLPADARPDQGALELEADDLLLLATDGIEPEASGLFPDDLLRIFRRGNGTLEDRVGQLLREADDPTRGGRDNLGVVAIRLPAG